MARIMLNFVKDKGGLKSATAARKKRRKPKTRKGRRKSSWLNRSGGGMLSQ